MKREALTSEQIKTLTKISLLNFSPLVMDIKRILNERKLIAQKILNSSPGSSDFNYQYQRLEDSGKELIRLLEIDITQVKKQG